MNFRVFDLAAMARALRQAPEPATVHVYDLPSQYSNMINTMETSFAFNPFMLVTATNDELTAHAFTTANERMHACIRDVINARVAAGDNAGDVVKSIIAAMDYIASTA